MGALHALSWDRDPSLPARGSGLSRGRAQAPPLREAVPRGLRSAPLPPSPSSAGLRVGSVGYVAFRGADPEVRRRALLPRPLRSGGFPPLQPHPRQQSAMAPTKPKGSAMVTGSRAGLPALGRPHPPATFLPAVSSPQAGQEFPAFLSIRRRLRWEEIPNKSPIAVQCRVSKSQPGRVVPRGAAPESPGSCLKHLGSRSPAHPTSLGVGTWTQAFFSKAFLGAFQKSSRAEPPGKLEL